MMPSGANDIGDFDWLRRWANLTPASIAFTHGETGESYTYAEAFAVCDALSRKLSSDFGISRGDRVAVLATNELETVLLFFAVLRLGAILVPINFRLTPREVRHVLDDSAAKLLIAQSVLNDTLDGDTGDSGRTTWIFADLQTFVASALTSKRSPPALDETNPRAAIEFGARSEEPCMILYTSGTTGSPKGAIVTPKMMHWNSINTTMRLNLTQTDVFVSFLPLFHTGGWNVLLTPFIHRGARVVFTKKFDADKILQLCETEKATIIFGVPTTMELLARAKRFSAVDLSSVRYAVVGGEAMSVELIRTWQSKGVPIRQGYGLTEFGPNVFSLDEADAIRKIGSIGVPNFYVESRVVDKAGIDVSPGEIGELWLRGPVCSPGYWRNESATREAIVDGWLRTGDLVRVDEEGYFFVAGRKKDMFISGGENVYPAEVERVLSQHPGIREVAVIGIPDERWGEAGCAFVALSEGHQVTAEALSVFCRDKLAKFKIPKEFRFLAELPKGDSGKILKRQLLR